VSAAVLFDLDGVLLDTEGLYTVATQRVLDRYGKTYDWALKVQTMGRDARIAARLIVDRLGLPLSPEELLAARDPILEELIEQSPAMAGAEVFVRGLHERGVPIAVATSSDRRLYERKIRPHTWFERFGAVVCGDDPRVRAKKPAPDIFLAAAADLGAAPAECVVFEDSPAGVEAALAAGMRVVALPPPQASRELYAGACAMVEGWHLVPPSVLGF
jgi:pseudouridine-5'-monophosphatase